MVKAAKVLALAAIVTLAACDKLETEQNAPTMSVTAPLENAVIQANDTLFMKVAYADDATITDYTVNIHQVNTDQNYFSYSKYIGAATADLDTFRILADTGHYELLLYVADNHDNFTNKTINFTVNP
jgi:hypothetical protein